MLLLVAILLIGMSEARWCFSRLGKFGRAYSSRWDSSVKKAVACACGGADAGGHVRARQSPLRQSGSAIRDYATRRPSPLTMSALAKITRTLTVRRCLFVKIWSLIMLVIRHFPEIFKKRSL